MCEQRHWHGRGTEAEFEKWMRTALCNNYRKMHGKPMRRRVQFRRLAEQRCRQFLKQIKLNQTVRLGNLEFCLDKNGNGTIMYVGESEG